MSDMIDSLNIENLIKEHEVEEEEVKEEVLETLEDLTSTEESEPIIKESIKEEAGVIPPQDEISFSLCNLSTFLLKYKGCHGIIDIKDKDINKDDYLLLSIPNNKKRVVSHSDSEPDPKIEKQLLLITSPDKIVVLDEEPEYINIYPKGIKIQYNLNTNKKIRVYINLPRQTRLPVVIYTAVNPDEIFVREKNKEEISSQSIYIPISYSIINIKDLDNMLTIKDKDFTFTPEFFLSEPPMEDLVLEYPQLGNMTQTISNWKQLLAFLLRKECSVIDVDHSLQIDMLISKNLTK